MPLVLVIAAALQQPAPACAMITFSRQAALSRQSEVVRVCFKPTANRHNGQEYRFELAAERPARMAAASTRTCPAARTQLELLERLELPAPDVFGLGRETEYIVMDGAAYNLTSSAIYGDGSAGLHLSSNVGTPLARWIDVTLAALAPCWRDSPPSVAR